ncbi:hypothetical protein [Actinomyces sp. Marseille-QA0893]
MDKKAVQILNRLMDDRKKHSVSAEDLAYARKMGVVVEDQPITHDQAIDILEQVFEAVSLEDATQAFLYSLSSRDVDYRYVLASYAYARSWLSFDRGRTQELPEKLTGSFFNWVKHKGGGIWGTIGKPIFYLEQFASMELRVASDVDVEILRSILELADSMEDEASGTALATAIRTAKLLPCNQAEAVGILETLGICGILDVPGHPGFLHSFTPPLERDTGDLRQSLSYPLNWWHGADGVNWENAVEVFGTDFRRF